MKRKIVCIAILILLLMPLVSCSFNYQKQEALFVVAKVSLPGNRIWDLKGTDTKVEILEEDSQGRILYSCKTKNYITGKKETAILVLQKYDRKHAYFYEDVCYILFDANKDEIAQLKKQNDWNKPLNESKMSRRAAKASFDHVLIFDYGDNADTTRLRPACANYFSVLESQIMDLWLHDYSTNQCIYLVQTKNSNGNMMTYFVVWNYNKQKIVAHLEVEELSPNFSLAELKNQVNWHYQ